MAAATSSTSRKRSQYVWAPHPLEGYVLGHVTDVGGDSLTVELVGTGHAEKQSIVAVYEDVYPAVDELFDKLVEDNCSLVYLNEATLLHNIHQRYKKDMIYSYVANILLAVNPYKEVSGLYTLENAKQYKGKSLGVLPPHVFAIADKVYRDLRTNKISQSVIVSGESGAGKTETTKFILRYLTQIYGAAAGIIEQRIVEANPILESFGNSTTVQNANSSRFGKFVEVHFDTEFKVVGGHVSHYLLEKSRVCSQVGGERNYHIFYHMLSTGAPKEMKQALGLDLNTQYNYLSNGLVEKKADGEGYHKLVQSMESIGMSNDEKIELFRITAAILHLGNIQFEEESYGQKGGSTVSGTSANAVHLVSGLLGIDKDDLCRSLTSRVMTTTKKGTVGTVIHVPLKPDQAANARDALAKAIYARLFGWIIERVNKCFPFTASRYYIGVLDIAGFEYYQFNSFEQFCINYCNEKLQQLFNERVLKEEQELYKREGLGIPTVRYVDNQDCIDLIESSGNGIIDILDEECKVPRGSNEQFTESIHKKFTGHFRVQLPRQSRLSQHKALRDEEGFIIRHFAGAVCYKTVGFLDKNNDALHSSLEQLLMTSSDTLIQSLFPEKKTTSPSLAKKLVLESVSSKFRTQLNQLMQKLRETDASFIRCLKPNQDMIPGKFLGGQVLSQLQCAGMVSVLKLMEGGYPSRTQFIDLYNMYKAVLPDDLVKLDPRMFCEALFRAIGIKDREFKFGHNKVFFRAGKFAEFDEVMQSDPDKLSKMILKVKQWLISKQWRKVIYGAISVQKLSRKIKYRHESAIVIQSVVRMTLALRKYRPRYRSVRDLKQLKEGIEELNTLALKLESNRQNMIQRSKELSTAVDKQIQELKTISLSRSRDDIDRQYNKLVNDVEKYMNELQLRQEQEKVEEEERKLMQQLKEKQEKEKRQREEEVARLKAQKEEEERQKEENKKKQELETLKYLQEKKEQEKRDQILAHQLQLTMDTQAMLAAEQERRDFELALRLSQNDAQSQAIIIEQSKRNQKQQEQQQKPSRAPQTTMTLQQIGAALKSYDLTKWKYAQLRDTINTSCDIKLIEECKDELHRRLRAYHSWRDANTGQASGENQRIPQQALAQTGASSMPTPTPNTQHRYFKVPFLRPSDNDDKSEKTRGWWYAHFDGNWIARQLELHPNQSPLLLYAGYDDMEMCELRLEETGLTRKKGAEISKEHFDEVWSKCGGKPYNPPTTKL